MRKFNFPDHSTHVKIGRFYVPTSLDDYVYVELADGCFERLDYFRLTRLLKELGVNVERSSWASWECDNWRLEGNYVRFHEEDCKWCHHSVKIPKEQVLETLLLLKCPHLSKRGKIVLKRCKSCLFFYDGCHYRSKWFKPIKIMLAWGWENFINIWKFRCCDWADWGASLNFRIENEKIKKELVQRLHHGLHKEESEHVISFISYYRYVSGEEYRINIYKNKLLGEIMASESNECTSYEDWDGVLWDLYGAKRTKVLHAFRRICYETHGNVDPIMHWKLLRKPMQLIFSVNFPLIEELREK